MTAADKNQIFGEQAKGANFKNRKTAPRQRITDPRELDNALKLNAVRTERLQKVSEERKRLWDALNEYVRQQGAAITSPPYGTPVRLEITTKDSPLPGCCNNTAINRTMPEASPALYRPGSPRLT